MSVVLVCLPGAPKVSEEAVRKDTELNKYLESRVEGENGPSEPMKRVSEVFVLTLFKLLQETARRRSRWGLGGLARALPDERRSSSYL